MFILPTATAIAWMVSTGTTGCKSGRRLRWRPLATEIITVGDENPNGENHHRQKDGDRNYNGVHTGYLVLRALAPSPTVVHFLADHIANETDCPSPDITQAKMGSEEQLLRIVRLRVIALL